MHNRRYARPRLRARRVCIAWRHVPQPTRGKESTRVENSGGITASLQGRYASALFQLASEQKAVAAVESDLDKLGEGDRFYLHIMDEVLAYQVDQVKVVEPENTEDLEIIPGGDYCTLVTCTPYAINTHRMLVRGARVPYTGEDEQPDTPQTVQYQQLNTGNVVKRIVDAWPWISVTGSVVIGGEALLLLLLLHRCKKREEED